MAFLELNPSESHELQAPSLLTARPIRAMVLGFLFLAAFALRVHGIKELPLEFHPVRQYRSAIMARSFYYQHATSVPEWKRHIAYLFRQRADTLEPPFLEYVASVAYRIIGKERVWIPRLFSSISWLIGGAFLYLAIRKSVSPHAALFSAAFYLFAPFGVMASRSFQPDPLMVMMFLVSLYCILLYCEKRSVQRFVMSAAVSALAVLVKPVCLFAIIAAFVSGTLSERGFRAGARNPWIWIFGLSALLPSLMFYGRGYLTGGYFRFVAEGSFRPHLYLDSSFWVGWLRMIDTAVGILPFAAGVFSLLLFPKGLARSLACGLWAGYLMFALAFNYAISTHSYYQLQLIPIVAFALAAAAVRFIELVERFAGPSVSARAAFAGVLLLVCVVVTVAWIRRNWESIYYEDRDQVTIAQRIGERTAHSQKAIMLSYASGELLEYHGELLGIPWPLRSEMHARVGWARPNLTVEQRFKEINQAHPSDYFIVTEMGEYRAQHELGEFLVQHFPLLVRDERYLVFDLRGKPAQSPASANFPEPDLRPASSAAHQFLPARAIRIGGPSPTSTDQPETTGSDVFIGERPALRSRLPELLRLLAVLRTPEFQAPQLPTSPGFQVHGIRSTNKKILAIRGSDHGTEAIIQVVAQPVDVLGHGRAAG